MTRRDVEPQAFRDAQRSFTRRAVLIGGAVVTTGVVRGLTPGISHATSPGGEAVRTGPYEITALLDTSGAFPLTAGQMFPGTSDADWRDARALEPEAFGPDDTWMLDFRCYLVRGPRGHLTLVDTGVGPVGSPAAWAPQPGRLTSALASTGVDPSDVAVVVLSHLHEDHYGGSVGLDGTPEFPNARYVVQQRELDGLGEADSAHAYLVAPLRATGQLDAVDGECRIGRPGSPAAGIRVLPTPGHTPGHQSVVVDGGRHRTILAGDVLVHVVQLVNPDVAYGFEQDPATARASRHALLDLARRSRARLGTAHLHRPFVIVE